jgi:hypothetical protein
MAKQRVSASPNSPSFQQLWESLGSKLIEAAQGSLLPKQRVVSSNLITRSAASVLAPDRGSTSSLRFGINMSCVKHPAL